MLYVDDNPWDDESKSDLTKVSTDDVNYPDSSFHQNLQKNLTKIDNFKVYYL